MSDESDYNMEMRLPLILVSASILFTTANAFGQYTPPEAVQQVKPNYPPEVLARIYGKHNVDVFVEVDCKGQVKIVDAFGPWKTCSGDDDRGEATRRAAVEVAKTMVFSPARRDGNPIDDTVILTFPLQGTMEIKPSSNPRKGGGVVNGKRVSIPVPKYPSKARKYRIAGEVVVRAEIDEQGNIYSVSPVSGHPLLLGAAAEAACRAKFTPTTFGGEPVKVGVQINFNFEPSP